MDIKKDMCKNWCHYKENMISIKNVHSMKAHKKYTLYPTESYCWCKEDYIFAKKWKEGDEGM